VQRVMVVVIGALDMRPAHVGELSEAHRGTAVDTAEWAPRRAKRGAIDMERDREQPEARRRDRQAAPRAEPGPDKQAALDSRAAVGRKRAVKAATVHPGSDE
jgi:hypothetical protein